MVAPLPTTKLSFDGSNLPIETVTVYRPSGAQVVRELGADIKVSTMELGRSISSAASLNHSCMG